MTGTLSVDDLDAHYSRVLDEARESISRSSALSDEDRQAVATKLGTLKEIVDRGSIGAVIDGFAFRGDRSFHGHDDSVAAVSIIDDQEYRRHAEQESRRRDVFAAEQVADAAATITDYEGHTDPEIFAVRPESDETGEQAPEDGFGDSAGFASYEQKKVVPPAPPDVPAPAPGSGPSMQYPAPSAAAGLDVGQPLDGSGDRDSDVQKPLPGYVRVPWALAQKVWARFRTLPGPVQIVAGVLVAILVVVGLFGRGSTATETNADPADAAIDINPNGNKPAVDEGLVELQPTGGVGSNCDVKGFEAARAFGKNKGDGWVCTRAHGIDGEFMEIDFGHQVTVKCVGFVPGLWLDHAGGVNEWNLHRLVTQVKILPPKGQPKLDPIKITDPTPAPAHVCFPKPFTATRISLIVQATIRPENPTQGAAAPEENADVDETFALSALKITGYDDARR